MARHVVLLRGINLGATNRISMPALREALTRAGFEDVRTLLSSGNVVLSSPSRSDTIGRAVGRVIYERFGLEIPVVVRSRAQLAKVVERNPLGSVATEPKRYQVTFFDGKLDAEVAARLEASAAPEERVAVFGSEVYAWHPEGIARSKLWEGLAGRKLGVTATSRNWSTVGKLLALASE